MRIKIPILIYLIGIAFLISGCSAKKDPEIITPSSYTGPSNPYPVDGAVNQARYVTVKWDCDGTPVDYTVYYTSDLALPFLKASSLPTTNKYLTLPVLSYGTKYYWKVVANYGSGVTIENKPWSFSTAASSGVPSYNGFALRLHEIHTGYPYKVYSTFQVLDINGLGVSTMKLANFDVLEDYQQLSQSESQLSISNHATVPYEIKTVLMLDNSTSVLSKSSEIVAAADRIIQNGFANQTFAVYVFSDNIIPLTSNNFVDKTTAQNSLANYFNGYESTDFYGAIVDGTKLWVDDYSYSGIIQGNMVIISDGGDTQGRYTLTNAVNATKNKLIYTVKVSSTDEQPEVMNAIGTGGSFEITDLAGVLNQLSELNQKVLNYANSFYDLSYSSPKRDQKTHTLSIGVVDNAYTGDESHIHAQFVLP